MDEAMEMRRKAAAMEELRRKSAAAQERCREGGAALLAAVDRHPLIAERTAALALGREVQHGHGD